MRAPESVKGARVRKLTRLAAAGLAMALAAAVPAGEQAFAQSVGASLFGEAPANPNSQMLLEADQLVYDNDQNVVSAVGNVLITYDNYTLTAGRVTYSRASGRVIALGNVEIIEPSGAHIFAEEIDVTDDFRDGFVSSLRVETADNTRFAAESAERREGEIAIFNNGVYTACEPCRENPAKPPLWQIRANRVIINNRTRRVEYEGASFELWGQPIAYLPRFSHADPSIKRQTGFLVPTPSYTETLGIGVKNSFFWAMAPNYDLTLSGTYYTNQGFLGEAEWRHRTENGAYNLRIAGIDQRNPRDFGSTTIDSNNTGRYAITSTGKFQINPRWTFGWNALWQTDENFARTYGLKNYATRDITNEVYLTGLSGKNYFDLRAQQFLVQHDRIDQNMYYPIPGDPLFTTRPGNQKLEDQQGSALPIFDYNRVSEEPVAGGEVSVDVNIRNIHRKDWQVANFDNSAGKLANERFHGIEGDNGRATIEAEWKRSEIFNGAVVTASLSAQADAIWLNTQALNSASNPLTSNESLLRAMPAGMLEVRYPMVARDGFATHLFEPIAQIVARPNETQIGKFPNEDAQSLVFDTTNLFERNKFSGFDRIEGGTRANVGFRYSASYLNGATLNIAAGQSYHLHGQNSFAQADLVNAGLESGLETTRSDYVVSASVNSGHGLSVGVSGRFDERSAGLRRGEATMAYSTPAYALAGSYVFIDEQPNYGFADDRHELNGSASVQLSEYWRGFASFSFDLQNNNLYQHSLGLAYDDSCFSLSVAYAQKEDRYTGDTINSSVLFRIGLRTIGDYDYKYSLDDTQ
ncbi:MAG: LPS-assembly protein LptD [Nitratireductor sp.]|nr:LPS-assembly protein LptD [Nitratireductor sp.]